MLLSIAYYVTLMQLAVRTKTQNNEMRYKIIAYNAARIASLTYSLFVGFLQGLNLLNGKILYDGSTRNAFSD
jgi:hypothetical protein